jgi:hypothetical protein
MSAYEKLMRVTGARNWFDLILDFVIIGIFICGVLMLQVERGGNWSSDNLDKYCRERVIADTLLHNQTHINISTRVGP